MRSPLFQLIAVCAIALPAAAADLTLPATSRLTASTSDAMGSVELPIAGWRDGGIETIRADGEIERQAWEIQVSNQTTLQLLAPLREELVGAGFEPLFECVARECGGFDFRYAIEVFPEPEMHVDLGDFRYILLRRDGDAGPDHVSLLVSRTTGRGFVQVTRATSRPAAAKPDAGVGGLADVAAQPAAGPGPAGSIAAELVANGRAVLGDLTFQTGSSELADSPFATLDELAAFLAENPEVRIVLVGHTDTDGTLAANVALSRKRAQAVMERLAEDHGIGAERMAAEGVGFLMPLTSNATEAGRTLNRRVEAILSDPG